MVISLMRDFEFPGIGRLQGASGASASSGARGWLHHFKDEAISKARDGIELQWMQHFHFLKNYRQTALIR